MLRAQTWLMIFDILDHNYLGFQLLETWRLQWNKRVPTVRLLDGGILVFAKMCGEHSRKPIGRDI